MEIFRGGGLVRAVVVPPSLLSATTGRAVALRAVTTSSAGGAAGAAGRRAVPRKVKNLPVCKCSEEDLIRLAEWRVWDETRVNVGRHSFRLLSVRR